MQNNIPAPQKYTYVYILAAKWEIRITVATPTIYVEFKLPH